MAQHPAHGYPNRGDADVKDDSFVTETANSPPHKNGFSLDSNLMLPKEGKTCNEFELLIQDLDKETAELCFSNSCSTKFFSVEHVDNEGGLSYLVSLSQFHNDLDHKEIDPEGVEFHIYFSRLVAKLSTYEVADLAGVCNRLVNITKKRVIAELSMDATHQISKWQS